MTKRKMPKGRPFPKGVSGNPKGREPDVLGKMMRQLTASEFASIANLVVKGNLAQLQAVAKDPNAPALKVAIAAVVVKTIQKGDMHSLDILLNRLVGKVKDTIEVSGKDGGPQVILTMPANGSEAPKPPVK